MRWVINSLSGFIQQRLIFFGNKSIHGEETERGKSMGRMYGLQRGWGASEN